MERPLFQSTRVVGQSKRVDHYYRERKHFLHIRLCKKLVRQIDTTSATGYCQVKLWVIYWADEPIHPPCSAIIRVASNSVDIPILDQATLGAIENTHDPVHP